MDARAVLRVLDRLDDAEIPWCIDGGWGVDALVRRETRLHSDLDLVLVRSDCPRAGEALAVLGYAHDATTEPGLPARFVLAGPDGSQVDLHVVECDKAGNGWQALGPRAWGLYPSADLGELGTIGGRSVRCISAELQLRHHLGYPWSVADEQDARALSEQFGTPLPPPN